MAIKTHWYCDRCGKEFVRKGFTSSMNITKHISLLLYDDLRLFSSKEIDLCKNCEKEFFRFLDEGKV